ncbi:hypothetical protein A9Q99_25075 [Gammaproteobacteria bacterium 45_16_T64]|nr:hypothetical protein A9Q99_25075 [Gammaproteobacteria bacterium 45_16_T64]
MNIKNFDMNLLRAFDALMRERNVSRAGERMSLTQPAMSNALNRLRNLLDDPVLVRTSKGMQPTPKAIGLESSIRSALSLIDQTLAPEPAFDPLTSTQTFHIATTDYVELVLLPRLIRHLKHVAPGVKIEIHALQPDIPELQLEEGEYDFALGRFVDLPGRLLSENWRSERLVCLVHSEHPDYGDTISESEFLQSSQIWVNGGQRTGLVDQWLRENNLTRNVVLTTPNFLMAPIIVAQSDLLVVTPLEVALQCIERLPLKILSLPMTLGSFEQDIIWHPFHASTLAHRWFREQLILMR